MIKINNLSFAFGHDLILKDINATIENGDYLAIIGPNGTGKSTLIKCLLGIHAVAHNQIQIDNQCISCFNDYHQIGYVEQVKSKQIELPITPYEIFLLITKDKKKINSISSKLRLEPIMKKNINTLSGGQRQRVAIAKALLMNIKYLILDEPTTGLDHESRVELQKLLQNLNDEGLTIIVVSHYLEDVKTSANSVLDLANSTYERLENA